MHKFLMVLTSKLGWIYLTMKKAGMERRILTNPSLSAIHRAITLVEPYLLPQTISVFHDICQGVHKRDLSAILT